MMAWSLGGKTSSGLWTATQVGSYDARKHKQKAPFCPKGTLRRQHLDHYQMIILLGKQIWPVWSGLSSSMKRLHGHREIGWIDYSRGIRIKIIFTILQVLGGRRTRLKKRRDDLGNWLEGSVVLSPMISQYFAGVFSTEVEELDPAILKNVVRKVMENMNADLMKPFFGWSY